MDRIGLNGPNRLNKTELTKVDQIDLIEPKWAEVN